MSCLRAILSAVLCVVSCVLVSCRQNQPLTSYSQIKCSDHWVLYGWMDEVGPHAPVWAVATPYVPGQATFKPSQSLIFISFPGSAEISFSADGLSHSLVMIDPDSKERPIIVSKIDLAAFIDHLKTREDGEADISYADLPSRLPREWGRN